LLVAGLDVVEALPHGDLLFGTSAWPTIRAMATSGDSTLCFTGPGRSDSSTASGSRTNGSGTFSLEIVRPWGWERE